MPFYCRQLSFVSGKESVFLMQCEGQMQSFKPSKLIFQQKLEVSNSHPTNWLFQYSRSWFIKVAPFCLLHSDFEVLPLWHLLVRDVVVEFFSFNRKVHPAVAFGDILSGLPHSPGLRRGLTPCSSFPSESFLCSFGLTFVLHMTHQNSGSTFRKPAFTCVICWTASTREGVGVSLDQLEEDKCFGKPT